MSDPHNETRPDMHEQDEETFGPAEPSHVWPPPNDPNDVSASLPAGGGGAVGEPAEFGWMEDTRELDETFEQVRNLEEAAREEDESAPKPDSQSSTGAPTVSPYTEPDSSPVLDLVTDTAQDEAPPTTAISDETATSLDVTTSAEPTTQPKVKGAKPTQYRLRSAAEGELSQLWTNVFFSGDRTPPKVVAVTAVKQGDGASQIAASLALLGADANPELEIALVDVNLRRPQIAEALNLKERPGLSEVIAGECTVKDAMQTIPLPHGATLHVLTAGAAPKHAMSLLKSRQLKSLIGQLRNRFDHTIIDVANANRHADAQIVGAHTDGVLLVTAAGSTPRETIADTKKRLQISGARCLGLVMNRRTDPIPALLYNMT